MTEIADHRFIGNGFHDFAEGFVAAHAHPQFRSVQKLNGNKMASERFAAYVCSIAGGMRVSIFGSTIFRPSTPITPKRSERMAPIIRWASIGSPSLPR